MNKITSFIQKHIVKIVIFLSILVLCLIGTNVFLLKENKTTKDKLIIAEQTSYIIIRVANDNLDKLITRIDSLEHKTGRLEKDTK